MASELMSPNVVKAPGLADQDDESSLPRIKVGICAMDKKAKSKPMKAILQRLLAFGEFEVELFGDDNIINKPVNQWPNCDCLLSWHSEGFPLKKVQQSFGSYSSPLQYTLDWPSSGSFAFYFLLMHLTRIVQAQQYAALRKPYLINDMLMQDILLDRRKVYEQLQVRMLQHLTIE